MQTWSKIEIRDSRFVDVQTHCYPLGPVGVTFDSPALLALNLADETVQAYVRALARLTCLEEWAASMGNAPGVRRRRELVSAQRRDVASWRREAGLDKLGKDAAPLALPCFDPLAA